MEYAYFTGWNLQQPGVKVTLETNEGNDSPEGMLPIILNADVYNFIIPIKTKKLEEYDWIVINNDKGFYRNEALVDQIFSLKKPKIAVMQEGPINDWQRWKMEWQWTYLKLLKKIDLFICNNHSHVNYYKHYTKNVCVYKPPVQLDKFISHKLKPKQNAIMLNGNFTKWYNAGTSLEIAKALPKFLICMQSMGKSQENEVQYLPLLIPNNNFMKIPFVSRAEWMNILSDFKYGVNMMTAIACGSFSLNCATVGILCIGNKEAETQRKLFPNLSIHPFDIKAGMNLLLRLETDDEFREEQYKIMREKVKEYNYEVVKKEMIEEFEKVK